VVNKLEDKKDYIREYRHFMEKALLLLFFILFSHQKSPLVFTTLVRQDFFSSLGGRLYKGNRMLPIEEGLLLLPLKSFVSWLRA